MSHAVLDNPVWSALTSEQSQLASGADHARRFPPDIAPFIAIPQHTPASADALAALVSPNETVCAIGVIPQLDARWRLVSQGEVGQLVRPPALPIQPRDEDDIRLLTAADAAAMNELTALVYPGYFRPGTSSLGDYYGIHHQGQLIAMAGERMRMTGHQEISAVCTHPQFLGRGLAARLITHLVSRIVARDKVAFLHVEAENTRAWSLYERLGFSLRATLPIWKFQRLPD